MPSKLKKAIGAVKDQTSISLAKVSNSSNAANLEVTILKATSHDVVPIEEKYVNEILSLISSNKGYAAACASAIAKRVGKTRNWIVALKSLMLVLRIFQDGDPYFPIQVVQAMKRGAKIVNLSNFRDDSNSPWDYTAFVRTFALYLDERLDCFLTGNLHRRDIKPPMMLDRIHYCQKLLDRAIATTPTGAAKTNRLVLICLHAIVQETYHLYRDISDGLALLLDSFFHLQYQSCVHAFHACVKASKQFEELSSFYGLCKSMGVGRTSEYPSVQKVSEELLETLQEFLKDQASFPGRSPPHLQLPPPNPKGPTTSDLQDQAEESERGSLFGSACTSLEDLMSATNDLNQPTINSNSNSNSKSSSSLDLVSFDHWPPPQPETDIQNDQEPPKDIWELVLFESANQTVQNSSSINDVDKWFQDSSLTSTQNQYNPFLQDLSTEAESFATTTNVDGLGSFQVDDLFSFPSTSAPTFCAHEQEQSSSDDTLALTLFEPDPKQSTMAEAPTFCAQSTSDSATTPTNNDNESTRGGALPNEKDDPFGTSEPIMCNELVNEESLLHQQRLWLEQQNKIITKHLSG